MTITRKQSRQGSFEIISSPEASTLETVSGQFGALSHQSWPTLTAVIMIVSILGTLVPPVLSVSADVDAPALPGQETPVTTTIAEVEVSENTPDAAPKEKLPVVPKPVATTSVRSFRAVVTQYSRKDSCHNIRNGKCLMASGKPVYVGAVACPNFLSLGTVVTVNGKQFTCEDRYAQRLDKLRGLPTIDVFVDENPRGRFTSEVVVMALDS